jgi:hypothetical protein
VLVDSAQAVPAAAAEVGLPCVVSRRCCTAAGARPDWSSW